MPLESGFVTRQLSYRSDVTASNPVLEHRRNPKEFQTTVHKFLDVFIGLFIKKTLKYTFKIERGSSPLWYAGKVQKACMRICMNSSYQAQYNRANNLSLHQNGLGALISSDDMTFFKNNVLIPKDPQTINECHGE